MKQCTKCGQLKPESEFSKNKTKADGLQDQCKECLKQYNKNYREANREQISERMKQYSKQWREANREADLARKKKHYADNPEQYLWTNAKARAKKHGLEFNLELSDIMIPEYCPILGLKLEQGDGKVQDNSPSLDRIDPRKGYVKGNVMVLSARANTIKSYGTAEEHRLIAEFLERNSK